MTGEGGIPQVPEIDVESAWKEATAGRSYILDVREPEELEEISLAGAIHIPLGSLPAEQTELPRDREILVICRTGVRSAYATQFLLNSGFVEVRNIQGGVVAWAEARLPYASFGQSFNEEG
jgi:rhodanese-related sulfurtransferase